MRRDRTKGDGGALGREAMVAAASALGFTAVLLAARPAAAGPGDADGQRGLVFARRGDCVKAIDLLEKAELARHRPSTAVALADCYVATGELTRASDLYHAVADEKPARGWLRADFNAQKAAKKKAADVDARIPTLRFEIDGSYEDLEIEVNGRAVEDTSAERRVQPDAAIEIVARAKGRKEMRDKLVLNERERRVVTIRLGPLAPATPPAPPKPKEPPVWFGVRYRGVVIPKFLMNAFADGGTNLVAPGGGFTVTMRTGDVDVVVGLGYMSYRMGETPFKGKGTPDTEWESVSSTLQALLASVDLVWTFPLDAKKAWLFRLGGSVGVGWTFLGDLHRAQVYPKNGKPGDPHTYAKCKGPNDPWGTYRYCNTLDKDADHYGNYAEPDWFHGGKRPLVYPWLVLPQLGLTWRVSNGVAIDLETGASLSGILTGLGVRFAL